MKHQKLIILVESLETIKFEEFIIDSWFYTESKVKYIGQSKSNKAKLFYDNKNFEKKLKYMEELYKDPDDDKNCKYEIQILIVLQIIYLGFIFILIYYK